MLTLGALWPIAFVWAFIDFKPKSHKTVRRLIHHDVDLQYLLRWCNLTLSTRYSRSSHGHGTSPIFVTIFCMAFISVVTVGRNVLHTRLGQWSVVTWCQSYLGYKDRLSGIAAKPNVPIKKGDVLFEIDPTYYQYAVNQAKAALEAARSDAARLAAGVQVAEASIAKAGADFSRRQVRL